MGGHRVETGFHGAWEAQLPRIASLAARSPPWSLRVPHHIVTDRTGGAPERQPRHLTPPNETFVRPGPRSIRRGRCSDRGHQAGPSSATSSGSLIKRTNRESTESSLCFNILDSVPQSNGGTSPPEGSMKWPRNQPTGCSAARSGRWRLFTPARWTNNCPVHGDPGGRRTPPMTRPRLRGGRDHVRCEHASLREPCRGGAADPGRCFGRAHGTCRSSNENLDFRDECLELRNDSIEV